MAEQGIWAPAQAPSRDKDTSAPLFNKGSTQEYARPSQSPTFARDQRSDVLSRSLGGDLGRTAGGYDKPSGIGAFESRTDIGRGLGDKDFQPFATSSGANEIPTIPIAAGAPVQPIGPPSPRAAYGREKYSHLFANVKQLSSQFADQIRQYKEHSSNVRKLVQSHERMLQEAQATSASIQFEALLNEVTDLMNLHERYVLEGKDISDEMLQQIQDISLRLQNTSLDLQSKLSDFHEKPIIFEPVVQRRNWFSSIRSRVNRFGSWLTPYLPLLFLLPLLFGVYWAFTSQSSHHWGNWGGMQRRTEERRYPIPHAYEEIARQPAARFEHERGAAEHLKDNMADTARNIKDTIKDTAIDAATTVKDNVRGAAQTASYVKDAILDRGIDAKDTLVHGAGRVADKVSDALEHSKEKLQEGAEYVYDKTGQISHQAMHKASELGHNVASLLHSVKDKTVQAAETAMHAASHAKNKVAEKVEDAGIAAKHTARRAAEGLGDLKDTVVEKVEDAGLAAKHTAQHAARKLGDWKDRAADTLDDVKDKAGDWKDKAADTLEDVKDKAAEKWQDTKDTIADKASDFKERVIDAKDDALHKARQVKEQVREGWEDPKDKAEHYADKAQRKASEAGEVIKDKAQDMYEGAMYTKDKVAQKAYDAGQRAKEGVENMADKARDAGYRAKEGLEDVADRSSEKIDDAEARFRRKFHQNEDGTWALNDQHHHTHQGQGLASEGNGRVLPPPHNFSLFTFFHDWINGWKIRAHQAWDFITSPLSFFRSWAPAHVAPSAPHHHTGTRHPAVEPMEHSATWYLMSGLFGLLAVVGLISALVGMFYKPNAPKLYRDQPRRRSAGNVRVHEVREVREVREVPVPVISEPAEGVIRMTRIPADSRPLEQGEI